MSIKMSCYLGRLAVAVGLVVGASLASTGCAKPIAAQYYTRTPLEVTKGHELPTGNVQRVGLAVDVVPARASGRGRQAGVDLAALNETAYLRAYNATKAFLLQANERQAFAETDWVLPERIDSLDCQLEMSVTYEHSGNRMLHYCLGRLVVNIYNGNHSRLLDRAVFFHEAMYTAKSNQQPRLSSEGQNVQSRLQTLLFDELIDYLGAIASPS